MREQTENWPLFLHCANLLDFLIIVAGFLTGGSYRVIFLGILLTGLGAAYSAYKIIRYIADRAWRKAP